MKGKPTKHELFRRLMDINREAFAARMFDTAYHALAGALHCVHDEGPDEDLLEVAQRAREQLTWIDENQPNYSHSSESAGERKHESIFGMLAKQAETLVRIHQHGP